MITLDPRDAPMFLHGTISGLSFAHEYHGGEGIVAALRRLEAAATLGMRDVVETFMIADHPKNGFTVYARYEVVCEERGCFRIGRGEGGSWRLASGIEHAIAALAIRLATEAAPHTASIFRAFRIEGAPVAEADVIRVS